MIHPTATVASDTHIPDDATIGAFCHIDAEVTIASGVILKPHATIHSGVTLEEGVTVHSFATIGNGRTPITIRKNCTIREFAHIGVTGNSSLPIHIGVECYIMLHTEIASGVTIEPRSVITGYSILNEGCLCQAGSIIGGKSTIGQNCTIGAGAMVGMMSTVMHDIPPFCLSEGNPATIRGLNLVGMRRRFESRDDVNSVKSLFKVLKRGDFDPKQTTGLLLGLENRYAIQLAEFVSSYQCKMG